MPNDFSPANTNPSVEELDANPLVPTGGLDSLDDTMAGISRRQLESNVGYYKQPRAFREKLSALFLVATEPAALEHKQPTGVKVHFDAVDLSATGGAKISILATPRVDSKAKQEIYTNLATNFVTNLLTKAGDSTPHIEVEATGKIIITSSKNLAAIAEVMLQYAPITSRSNGR